MSKSRFPVLNVADSEPDENVVDFSEVDILILFSDGAPSGKRSKCGPGLVAPFQ